MLELSIVRAAGRDVMNGIKLYDVTDSASWDRLLSIYEEFSWVMTQHSKPSEGFLRGLEFKVPEHPSRTFITWDTVFEMIQAVVFATDYYGKDEWDKDSWRSLVHDNYFRAYSKFVRGGKSWGYDWDRFNWTPVMELVQDLIPTEVADAIDERSELE